MNREEAIRILKKIIEAGWLISDFNKCKAIDACEMAIEALEQEPILDKIRTEIEQAADKHFQIAMHITDSINRYTHMRIEDAYRHSLNIIDKYKVESEE